MRTDRPRATLPDHLPQCTHFSAVGTIVQCKIINSTPFTLESVPELGQEVIWSSWL